jgi:hypothetical protein
VHSQSSCTTEKQPFKIIAVLKVAETIVALGGLKKYLFNNNNNNNNKYITANAGASDMGTINSSDRIAAILYSLGTWFVSGIDV